MKTIQAVARYFPDNCGGIQIRLSELIPILQTYGVDSKIVAPQESNHEATYTYGDIDVYRYPVVQPYKSEPNYGGFQHGGFEKFANWLGAQDADIYHQHQWTPTCGLPHLRLAKRLGMATIVSIRLPEPICQRQTMMLNGEAGCDGKIDVVRCSQCCGVSSTLPPAAVRALSKLPLPVSIVAAGLTRRLRYGLPTIAEPASTLISPLATPRLVAARHEGLLEMAKYADRIVTLSHRLRDMLILNGVPEEKLVICKTGLIADSFVRKSPTAPGKKAPLRVVFLGRWNKNKGIHILVEAIKLLPEDTAIELTIHGIPNDESYQHQVEQRIGNDPRIRVAQKLSRQDLPSVLSTYDVLALPAQWFDVRPMAVLEAHALGLPVIGSDLGGIPELINHGVDGLLVPPTNVNAWANALAQLVHEPHLLTRLQHGIQPVRTIDMEAADTVALYQELNSARHSPSALELQPTA